MWIVKLKNATKVNVKKLECILLEPLYHITICVHTTAEHC